LPLAYEYQCEEILRRCVDFLKQAPLRHMDKIVLADQFQLDTLLAFCLKQIRTGGGQVDFYSSQYERLSDRTKVQILEKCHHIKASNVMSSKAEVRFGIRIKKILSLAANKSYKKLHKKAGVRMVSNPLISAR
jgi:hypothetical protein